MGLIILVAAVVGAFFIMKLIEALLAHFLPEAKWALLLCKLAGLGAGLVYIYFTGYFVMGKGVNLTLAWLAALAPWAVYIGWKLTSRARLIEG